MKTVLRLRRCTSGWCFFANIVDGTAMTGTLMTATQFDYRRPTVLEDPLLDAYEQVAYDQARLTAEAVDAHREFNNLTQITHVAIQYAGLVWMLPPPNRHHNVIRMIAEQNGVGVKGPDVQGFVCDTGDFLNRRQAFGLAAVNGQLKRRPGEKFYQGKELYSEDLW